jgi:peptidoglycan/xylan/chitin deacetylase (PgdA/CDA1 family)
MTEKSNSFAWPNEARIAVAVTCLLENWSGDKGPPFSVQTTALKPGTHDRAAMTWGTYGGRAGVWRLMKILDANAVPATFCANAQSMELAPQAVEQMLRSGHEIAAHSYTQDNIVAYLERDEEQAVIGRCIEVFRKLTGAPPKGWLSPVLASSEHTEELLTAAGFLWYGDYNHIDLPFCVPRGNGRLRRPSGATGQSARLVRRLQGHLRLPLSERADRVPQCDGPLPFRRPTTDGGHGRQDPEVFRGLSLRLDGAP